MSEPSLAFLVGRWGGWPPWTPLLMRSFSTNPSITFITLSDSPPAAGRLLPSNVRHVPLSLEGLLVRMRRQVGCTLRTLSSASSTRAGSGGNHATSSSKSNDFKPMWGLAFADLLAGYDWWGYLQEDLVVGDLRAAFDAPLLASSDVVSPFLPPLNASGILMMFRNNAYVNSLWNRVRAERPSPSFCHTLCWLFWAHSYASYRILSYAAGQSRAAHRVLSTGAYLVFDEGFWGPLAHGDSFARVLGRESDAGRLRLTRSSRERHWMADDKQYAAGHPPTTNEDFVACWHRGTLYANSAAKSSPCTLVPPPPKPRVSSPPRPDARPTAASVDGERADAPIHARADHPAHDTTDDVADVADNAKAAVALVHLSRLKRRQAYARLRLDGEMTHRAVAAAETFALTAYGVWLPEPTCLDKPRWRNQYGLGCIGYESEGHCAGGRLAAGHAWAGGESYAHPERACCACGRPNATAASVGSVAMWASGLHEPSGVVRVPADGAAAHLRSLERRRAALRAAARAAARCRARNKRAKAGTIGRACDHTPIPLPVIQLPCAVAAAAGGHSSRRAPSAGRHGAMVASNDEAGWALPVTPGTASPGAQRDASRTMEIVLPCASSTST